MNFLQKPFVRSLLLHLIILISLLLNVSFTIDTEDKVDNLLLVKNPIISTVFDAKDIDKEVLKIEKEELQHSLDLKHQQDLIILQNKKMKEDLQQLKKQKDLELKKFVEKSKEINNDISKQQQKLKKLQDDGKIKKLEEFKNNDLANFDKQLMSEKDFLDNEARKKNKIDSEMQQFRALLQKQMSSLWLSQQQFLGKNFSAVLELNLDVTGKIISSKIFKSSGNEALDLSVKMAANKLDKIIIPDDPDLYKLIKTVHFTFRPDDA